MDCGQGQRQRAAEAGAAIKHAVITGASIKHAVIDVPVKAMRAVTNLSGGGGLNVVFDVLLHTRHLCVCARARMHVCVYFPMPVMQRGSEGGREGAREGRWELGSEGRREEVREGGSDWRAAGNGTHKGRERQMEMEREYPAGGVTHKNRHKDRVRE